MRDDTTTGIPDPNRPGHWLVPTWPTAASFADEAFQAALESAATGEPTGEFDRRWRAGMCECAARCVQFYRNESRHGEYGITRQSPPDPAIERVFNVG